MSTEARRRFKSSKSKRNEVKQKISKEGHGDDQKPPKDYFADDKDAPKKMAPTVLRPYKQQKYSEQEDTETVQAGTYWFTRVVYLRYLAFIYCVAFSVALNQNKQLIGNKGLLPANNFINQINEHFGSNAKGGFFAVPSILLFMPSDGDAINWSLDAIAYIGLGLALVVLISGCCSIVIMFLLWILYHSLVNVGQRWYSFGWESQLLETGFLAIIFCPLLDMRQYPRNTKPSWVALYGNKWLIFRIMIGAGWIKIRGDKCWRDLTCMNYHYQTQPVPNPVSYYLHQSPDIIHKIETLGNHFVELVAPFFIFFMNRSFTIAGGIIQVMFQVILIISGNLSFLNWLTILPSLCCFDDKFLLYIFPLKNVREIVIDLQKGDNRDEGTLTQLGRSVRKVYEIMMAILIAYLSIPVVKNLLSSNQAMNTSFDSFRIVNTYGAFGSITKTRTEVIFQGTRNHTVIPNGIWHEYEFKCKPGDIKRRPCLISPYHYRLDWLMWFAAFQNYQHNPWIIHLAAKLLVNEKEADDLIQYNPFKNGKPPRFIRGEHYLYEFTKIGSKEAKNGQWWTRKRIGEYFPIIDLKSLKSYLRANNWQIPRYEGQKRGI